VNFLKGMNHAPIFHSAQGPGQNHDVEDRGLVWRSLTDARNRGGPVVEREAVPEQSLHWRPMAAHFSPVGIAQVTRPSPPASSVSPKIAMSTSVLRSRQGLTIPINLSFAACTSGKRGLLTNLTLRRFSVSPRHSTPADALPGTYRSQRIITLILKRLLDSPGCYDQELAGRGIGR
jgi:hypothetical protein